MRTRFTALVMLALSTPSLAGDPAIWPTFADETASRISASPDISTADIQEKDYAWGDVDNDGDIDLVCVRKEPWNTPGRFRNVLFMNEGVPEGHALNGVLVDRTIDFASDADDGGNGLLDLTADRDVILVDLNDDGWLDMVTAPAYGEGLPKSTSHPRIYRNLGEDGGIWQGFRYEESRTPTLPIVGNFSSVASGDVNGDDHPDLYLTDYNNDLEDRLWINDGTGAFADESTVRMTPEMRFTDFGVHAVIADMNGDGVNDIVRDRASTTSTPPLIVTTSFNDPDNEGVFAEFEITYSDNPYFVNVGDLNNDGRLDIVIQDDSTDRYLLNQGNGGDGLPDYIVNQFSADNDSFGGNILITDVNQDGFRDVLVADVDVDCCGCNRHMRIWRNQGDGPDVTFVADSSIPIPDRTGTHDVAVFDLNGDGWDDIVIGTCGGMSVWIAQGELAFEYPLGLPESPLSPESVVPIQVSIAELVAAQLDPSTAMLNVSFDGGAFEVFPLSPLGGSLFEAMLPASPCGSIVNFYVSANQVNGTLHVDPVDAPAVSYERVVASALKPILTEAFEDDVSMWTVENISLTGGAWEQANPNSTFVGVDLAAPEDDATPGAGNVQAFITQNGTPGGNAGQADVDGGPTRLISPAIDLSQGDAIASFARWMFTSSGTPDTLTVDVSNDDGATWTPVPELDTTGTDGTWEAVSFRVGSVATPTDEIRIRFATADNPNNSVTEAGIDDLLIRQIACTDACPADVAEPDNGLVDIQDLLAILSAWGTADQNADIAPPGGNGVVDVQDLLALLSAWGPCE